MAGETIKIEISKFEALMKQFDNISKQFRMKSSVKLINNYKSSLMNCKKLTAGKKSSTICLKMKTRIYTLPAPTQS